jgi:hypothetical protein
MTPERLAEIRELVTNRGYEYDRGSDLQAALEDLLAEVDGSIVVKTALDKILGRHPGSSCNRSGRIRRAGNVTPEQIRKRMTRPMACDSLTKGMLADLLSEVDSLREHITEALGAETPAYARMVLEKALGQCETPQLQQGIVAGVELLNQEYAAELADEPAVKWAEPGEVDIKAALVKSTEGMNRKADITVSIGRAQTPKTIIFFSNGMAAVTDQDGQQIGKFQGKHVDAIQALRADGIDWQTLEHNGSPQWTHPERHIWDVTEDLANMLAYRRCRRCDASQVADIRQLRMEGERAWKDEGR